jgi:hypothetical protein
LFADGVHSPTSASARSRLAQGLDDRSRQRNTVSLLREEDQAECSAHRNTECGRTAARGEVIDNRVTAAVCKCPGENGRFAWPQVPSLDDGWYGR